MAKRKRNTANKSKNTAGPLSEHSGQRSVFPEVAQSSIRDTEWRYDDEEEPQEPTAEANDKENEPYSESLLVGQTFSLDQLDFGDEGESQEEEEEEEEEERMGAVIGEVEDNEWEVEPQTEALAYLQTVRNEAESLPALRYVPQEVHTTNGINGINEVDKSKPISSTSIPTSAHTDPWRTQFLQYYTNLRTTIANAETPIYTQPELDSLLHINPLKRPHTSSDEDALWRIKTLDSPSLPLLSMLDHQRTLHLLTHLRKKMSANVREEQCMWLVFLLARLGDPGVLSGEEVDLLRRIGRKCINVRNEAGMREVVLGTIDMVVCIITEYYAQRDLEEAV